MSRGIDADRGLTRCTGCNALFELSSLRPLPGAPPPPPPRARPQIPMRRWATKWEQPGLLELRVRRRSWGALGRLAFGALFLGFWLGGSSSEMPDEDPVFWLFYSALFLSIGGILTWVGLADLVNSTVVRLRSGRVSVHTGPLPPGRRVELVATTLSQLYCLTEVRSSDYGGLNCMYSVWALLQDGSKRKLAGGFDELDQALWLEQQIEQALGIRDEPVPGEGSVWGTDRMNAF